LSWYKLLFMVACIFVAIGVSNADEMADIANAAKYIGEQKQIEGVMKEFIESAKKGDVERMYELESPLAKSDYGKERITTYYKNVVIPFFSDYVAINNVQGIHRITGEHQQDGWAYYLFSDTSDTGAGKKPFAIQIFHENGRVVIGKVIVGQCVKGGNPLC
jgi:hypothetical protein